MTTQTWASAPHRAMFLGGSIQSLLAMAFWVLQTGGHYAGLWLAPEWPILNRLPLSHLHAMLMGSGVLPWFTFGFILTAGPRWQGAADLARRDYLPPFALFASGWALVWAGLMVPVLMTVGLLLAAVGWLLVAAVLFRLVRTPQAGGEHMAVVAAANALGAAGLVADAVLAATANPEWGRLGVVLNVWGFLLPVFLSVSHRMLPFFTSAMIHGYVVRRPALAFRVLLVCSVMHGTLEFFHAAEWQWLADFPGALAAGQLAWLWWHREVLRQRMVLVLHMAFAWLAPAFALLGLQSIGLASGFGQAPLHLLTIGYFSSMLIAMVSRVTRGHSGQPVMADTPMWLAFLLMQATVLLRVAGELPGANGRLFLVLSASTWLTALAIWVSGYLPMLWRPRSNGRPG